VIKDKKKKSHKAGQEVRKPLNTAILSGKENNFQGLVFETSYRAGGV
jgi:hypothetical protein